MGFKPTRDVHNLKYRQYPGLEITARGTTIGKLQKMQSLRMHVDEDNAQKINETFGFFANRIVTWNVEHPEIEDGAAVCDVCGLAEGQPLPTTVEAMYCLELKFILSLIFGWMAAIASVADPKELSSNIGAMPSHTEDQMQMEIMNRLAEMQNQ